ncbi:phage tail protein [Brevundimonas sp.]|uniref:phage tail protein n=1 Tax=Brevundimonas sp. TaxID=1871086 RepID=UPI003D0F3136
MSDPYLGEVQIFGFSFAPRNWAFAAGQSVPLRQYSALYALYGTVFGGDGVTTFALPNLASRQACGQGQSPGNSRRQIGQTFGTPAVALTSAEMPFHNHGLNEYEPSDPTALTAVPTITSAIGIVGNGNFQAFAAVGAGATVMNPNAIGMSGNGTPHENRQPYLGLNYSVALTGVFPSFN